VRMNDIEAHYGSDFIVQLLKDSGIRYVAMNPGATIRGIHDTLVNDPEAPELIMCLHETVAVSVAQGYAKAAGEPMAVLLHNVVGLQNASMAIFNAWCDRAPVLLIGGTGPKSTPSRRPWIDWIHTASVQANIIRDFVKWDDEPHDIYSVEESFARALTTLNAAPNGPVYLCYDVALQEDPLPQDFISHGLDNYVTPSPPAATSKDLDWIEHKLREAQNPVILAGYTSETEEAFSNLQTLAEALGAPVIDTGVRHAFPSTHDLAGLHIPELLTQADTLLALDVEDVHSYLDQFSDRSPTLVNVSLGTLKLRGWAHDYQEMVPGQRHIVAHADEVVNELVDRFNNEPLQQDTVVTRREKITTIGRAARQEWVDQAHQDTTEDVVSIDRLLFEVARAVEGHDYVIGGGTNARHEHRYFQLDRFRQYNGWAAGGGLGYGVGGSIGVALAQSEGTITIDIQADGDLLYLPSALWTAAHKSLPVLIVVHNNRQYGNTVEHAQNIAEFRDRDPNLRYVGSGIADPPVDLAQMAQSFGVWAAGPISTPEELRHNLMQAVEITKSGKPALLDVLTPGF